MKTINIWWNEVLYSEYKFEENEELREILSSQKLQVFLENIPNDVIVVLWGDGTMLEAIWEHYLQQRDFLGINFGNKGFLLNSGEILDNDTKLEERVYPLLEMCIDDTLCAIALNEFDIKAWDGKMLDLDLVIAKGHHLSILWDGIIVSTPIGSTGYNSSLWWPILPHNLSSYILTPKAPWKPKWLAPIILSDDIVLTINTQGRQSPIELYADGRMIEKYETEDISLVLKKSDVSVRFLVSAKQSDGWDSRVLEEQGFLKNAE